MPFIELRNSPRAPGVRPVRIHYRDVGSGLPVIFLHGGWGYGVYPIDHQIEAFQDRIRFVIPDRSGYGRSAQLVEEAPLDFHQRAAEETLLLLEALNIERATLWGHSDGAVIAARIGLTAPQRCQRLILEACHFGRAKPGSRRFFERFAAHPDEIKEGRQRLLAADHGEKLWKNVVQSNCRAWLKLATESEKSGDESGAGLGDDLFDGRLSQLQVPVTIMHGRNDPRTEPGEMEQAHAALPGAAMRFIEVGRHSPHNESKAWQECNRILGEFLPASDR